MKNIVMIFAFVLFSLNSFAQETTAATQEKQEKSCAKHDSHEKEMTKEEMKICKAKCKAEGKKCTAKSMTKCEKKDKKCCAKKATTTI